MKPKYMTEERMRAGIHRLLTAPADLAVHGARIIQGSPTIKQAPEPYAKLHAKYRKELKKVMAEAVEWWDGRTEVLTEELGNDKQARMANWRELPAGPASDPYTVAVVRKYWLACDELNDSQPAGAQVAPEVFLLQWVVDEGDMATAEILSGMPYWPMGLDDSGNWS